LPVLTFSVAAALTALLEQASETVVLQGPLNISTTGLKPPTGLTITVSEAVTAEKLNQTSGAEVDVEPLQTAGAKDWVALVLENIWLAQVRAETRLKAASQLSLSGVDGPGCFTQSVNDPVEPAQPYTRTR
jgi:hypothetical protein